VSGDIYVVMGVAGSGKTRVGAALARALGVEFVEGDDYHPAENVARMAAGVPLTDADRAEWLRSIALRMREGRIAGVGLVVACSALKRRYRDVLRAESGVRDLRLVFLRGEQSLIADRLTSRRGHFMPPSLLESQFDALEKPAPDEDAWVCDIRQPPDDIVASLVARAQGPGDA
jgi:gluconokinase